MTFKTIKQQIIIFGSASLIAVVVATLAFNYFNNQTLSKDINQVVVSDTSELIQTQLTLAAKVEAGNVAREFNSAMYIAATLVNSFSVESASFSRESVNAMLQNTLTTNPKLLGIYSGWESNQFDGADQFNTNTPHSFSSGVFSPYWTRSADGTIAQEVLGVFYDTTMMDTGVRVSEWYLCPRETQQACIIDPASYDIQGVPTLLSSFVAPVLQDGAFVGMFGVDYSLNFLQSIAQQTSSNLFSGLSQVIIVSAGGTVSADSRNPAHVGQKFVQLPYDTALTTRKVSETIVAGDQFITSVLFNIAHSNASWEIIISTPTSVALDITNSINADLQTRFDENLQNQLMISGLVCLLGIALMWLTAQSITQPIRYLVHKIKLLAQSGGDLTQELHIKRQDETGQLASNLNAFIGNVRHIVSEIAHTSTNLTDSANITAETANTGLSQIASQQQEIEQVATATNQMSVTAHNVANNAQETEKAVSETQVAVRHGQHVVSNNADALQTLAANVSTATEVVTELDSKSEGIVGILDVIRNISDQTNLLALNAAIEAARAGEQGRGFAVVADEVRNLATQTANSTDEIQDVITALRSFSKEAVAAMNTSSDLTSSCLENANNAVTALEEINVQSSRIQDMAHEIANAAEDQATVTEDVHVNIEAISAAAMNIADGAKTSQQESTNVAQFTQDVNSQIHHFKF